MAASPEVWLRGPLPGFAPELMPAAHSLLQVREEIEAVVSAMSHSDLWSRPGGAASVGFHLRHLAGSLDRLLTYARGEELTDAQRAVLAVEERDVSPEEDAGQLLRLACQAIDGALDQLKATPPKSLHETRWVGRAKLPSTVAGLLFHAAEHAQRHAGQIATTVRAVRGIRAGDVK